MGLSTRFLSGSTVEALGTFQLILEVSGRPGIIANVLNFKTSATGGTMGSVELRITVDGVTYNMVDKLGTDYGVLFKGVTWNNSIKIEAKLASTYTMIYHFAYMVEV